jgi:hypothetical protein
LQSQQQRRCTVLGNLFLLLVNPLGKLGEFFSRQRHFPIPLRNERCASWEGLHNQLLIGAAATGQAAHLFQKIRLGEARQPTIGGEVGGVQSCSTSLTLLG